MAKGDKASLPGRTNPSDEIAIFQAYVELINSERETIWARHNALLVANSLILGSLALSPASIWADRWEAVALLAAGLIVSVVWLLITLAGWRSMRHHAELAGAFAASCFADLPNPFAETVGNRSQGSIHRLALLMVGVFIVIYLGLGAARLAFG